MVDCDQKWIEKCRDDVAWPTCYGGRDKTNTVVRSPLTVALRKAGPNRALFLRYPFENKYHYSKKVAKIASWLGPFPRCAPSISPGSSHQAGPFVDQPRATRPHLITAYAPEVDQEGHRSGPYSGGVEQTLKDMDLFAKDLVAVLEARNLTDVVDVIFVSDHGMTGAFFSSNRGRMRTPAEESGEADTHNERLVFLDDILGREGFEGIESNEGTPFSFVSPLILH